MRTLILSMAVMLCANLLDAQKGCDFSRKSGEYVCAGKKQFTVEDIKSVNFPGVKDLYVLDSTGKRVILFQFNSFELLTYNKNGQRDSQPYYEVFFLDSQQSCEVRFFMVRGNLADMIYEEKLMVDGALNEAIISQFIMKFKHKFSDKRNQLYPQNQTIIINNQTPQPRNGININIGN